MAKLKKGTFPGIVRKGRQDPTSSAITENIEILTGQRGNNRALLISDLVDLDDMKRKALINSASSGTNSGGLPIATGGVERPHAPVNLSAAGGFTFIAVSWEHPTYRGHAYAEIWRSETDSFGSATLIATEVADVFSDTVSMGAKYYYWVRFVNVADMKGPTQGAAGVFAETQQSAEIILNEIGGQIEKSHLGTFLTSEISKIPAFDFLLSDIIETEIPALKVNIDDFSVDIQSLRAGVNQSLEDIPIIQDAIQGLSDELPEIQQELTDLSNDTESARQIADNAKQRVESVEVGSDSLARQLIESALTSDINWQNNTTKLVEFESSLSNVTARIESEVFTKAEANEVIAAAAETIRVEIEATGLSLSGEIESTYYTKATTDQAIAAASQQIKSQIEDVNGDSVGALLDSQYYTVVEADSAISLSAEQVKSEIESPTGNSLGALINNDYYSSVDTDTAIAAYGQQLKSEIENPNGNSIGATLKTDHYTRTEADNAISEATTQLGAEVTQEIDGAINTVNSNLTNNYYTSAATEQAIAISSQFLKSQIENPEGVSLGATLFNDYSTKVDTEEAVSRAIFELDSRFDPISEAIIDNALAYDEANDRQLEITANILRTQEAITNEAQAQAFSIENIETQFNESSARITQLTDALSSEISSSAQSIFQLDTKIEDNFSYLEVNYLTQVDTETAISTATTALKSTIDSDIADGDQGVKDEINADLQVNYSTTAETNTAISQAATALKSEIEDPSGDSLGATLFNEFQTKADAQEASASSEQQLRAVFEPSAQAIIENALAGDLGEERRTLAEADIINRQNVFANEQSALSESITALNSSIDESKASLYQLQTTFANKTKATAQDLLKLDSDVGNVKADLVNNYFTSAKVNEAIASADTALRAAIEDPSGDSIGADLQTNYYTKAAADSAISSATTQLKSAIEDPNGDSVGADLYVNYSTTAEVNQAISSARTALQSNIDGNKSQLETNYYTKTDTDSAISQATTTLKSTLDSDIGDLSADLQTNYYTKTDTDSAISESAESLQSSLGNGIGYLASRLETNYYTKTGTNSAISTANQVLKAAIEDENGNSLGASLQTLGETVATNEGAFSALWGVKANVNGLQSSVGLVNDGVEPVFAVKGAKLAVITDQDPTNLTPVFAVSDGKTVINTAIIDEAFIKSLVTDDLLANRVIVGSRFTSPSINYNPSNGARSGNFSIDPNGNMLAKSATLESVTIKDNYGNVVMSSTGAIPSSKVTGLGDLASKDSVDYDELTGKPALGSLAYLNSLAYDDVTGKPSLGPFAGLSKILSSNVTTYIANGAIGSAQIDQAYINQLFGQNASFFGTVYAQNIEGDVYDAKAKDISVVYSSNTNKNVVSFTVSALPFARNIVISGVQANGQGYNASSTYQVTASLYRNGYSSAIDTKTWTGRGDNLVTSVLPAFITTLPANTSRTYTIKFDRGSNGTFINGTAICSAFKDGSTIS